MQEICYCGWTGDLIDRGPVLDERGDWALRCPSCGHLDYLRWLPAEMRERIFEYAGRGQTARRQRAA